MYHNYKKKVCTNLALNIAIIALAKFVLTFTIPYNTLYLSLFIAKYRDDFGTICLHFEVPGKNPSIIFVQYLVLAFSRPLHCYQNTEQICSCLVQFYEEFL